MDSIFLAGGQGGVGDAAVVGLLRNQSVGGMVLPSEVQSILARQYLLEGDGLGGDGLLVLRKLLYGDLLQVWDVGEVDGDIQNIFPSYLIVERFGIFRIQCDTARTGCAASFVDQINNPIGTLIDVVGTPTLIFYTSEGGGVVKGTG